MILTELILSNFKAHRNKVVNFNLGLNGIVGDNGAGKTCILDAIEFLFTGELSCKKEDAITRGQGDGYVRGKFTLNGVEGVIERHLGSSKVLLEYNGKKLHKAGDVKDLWATLLQIDNHIFRNVIVAKQNEIRLLFTGDSTVREKVFQKIFMVPPTDKIRNIVYTYIKSAPALLPEEDVMEIEANIAAVSEEAKPLTAKMLQFKEAILSAQQLMQIMDRINFVNKCIEDIKLRPALDKQIADNAKSIATNKLIIAQLESELVVIDYQHYKKLYEQLMSAQALWKVKYNLSVQFDRLNQMELVSAEKIESWKQEVKVLQQRITELSGQFAVKKSLITNIDTEITTLRRLSGCGVCPTCKQELDDVHNFITAQQLISAEHKQQQQVLVNELNVLRPQSAELEKKITESEELTRKIQTTLTELSKYNNVRFRQENFDVVKSVVEDYEMKQGELNDTKTKLAKLQGTSELLTNKLKNLNNYDDPESTPEEELTTLRQVVEENTRRQKELTNLQVRLGQMSTEIRMLKERINLSKENRAKNTKISAYVKTLTDLYELLHVTQFPRQLIETYSDVVEEELVQYVQKFNIKYRPRIVSGFAIEMVDEAGHVMPEVSGAQQNIVGLSLRLALHRLFGQNFPILIIDEGTTNMDEGNRAKYFEAIAGLKAEGLVRQIIVIDHDPMLATVVDNVINV